jgi:hypothetical protein
MDVVPSVLTGFIVSGRGEWYFGEVGLYPTVATPSAARHLPSARQPPVNMTQANGVRGDSEKLAGRVSAFPGLPVAV